MRKPASRFETGLLEQRKVQAVRTNKGAASQAQARTKVGFFMSSSSREG